MTPATSSHAASGWIAIALGTSFALGTLIFLFIEPRMGFETPEDFWNPALVVPALSSTAWLVGDLLHLANGTLTLWLGHALRTGASRTSAVAQGVATAAGSLFILVAMVDRAGAHLPRLMTEGEALSTLAVGLVATRMGMLYAALFLIGLFAILAAWGTPGRSRWLKGISTVTGLAAMGFFLVPTPVPLLLALWALSLGIGCLRARPEN